MGYCNEYQQTADGVSGKILYVGETDVRNFFVESRSNYLIYLSV